MTEENRELLTRINKYSESVLGEIDPQKVPVSAQLEALRPIMENSSIFGVNLYEAGLAEKVLTMFCEMMKESGAVRKTLEKYILTDK